MTTATPLLAYLQALQQGRQQSEQMRQQFATQNLERQKENAQFMMELGDKAEARKQQREQFDFLKADRARQAYLDQLAQGDRERAQTKADEEKNAAVNAYITGRTSPLSKAYQSVIGIRKRINDFATNGKRLSPTAIQAINDELSKAESDYKSAREGFMADTANDTSYGIKWDSVANKYNLPEYTLPQGFVRKPYIPQKPDAKLIPGVGTGDLKPTSTSAISPLDPTGGIAMGSPVDSVLNTGVLPAQSFLGIGLTPPNQPVPAKVAPVDPLLALAEMRTRLAKGLPQGEWSNTDLDPQQNEVINKLVDAYFASRGGTFRSKNFKDTVYGGDLSGLLGDYRSHVANPAEIQRFIDENLVGDYAEYSPNIVARVASRLADKGYIDPKVMERLAGESSAARKARADEQEIELKTKAEQRAAAKAQHERSLWQLEGKEATLKVQKLRKELYDLNNPKTTTGKEMDPIEKLSKANRLWNDANGTNTVGHINSAIKTLEAQKKSLPLPGRGNAVQTSGRMTQIDTQLSALRGLLASINNGRSDFLRAAMSGDTNTAMNHLNTNTVKFRRVFNQTPGLQTLYDNVVVPEVTSDAGAGGRAGAGE